MSAPDEEAGVFEMHPVVGVAIMFCDKCGYLMAVEGNGRDANGHQRFEGTCTQCKVVVAVPVMITGAAVMRKLP
jgi:hypothetical protein